MTPFWSPPERITIARQTWRHALAEVAARGSGRREAGGFFLAPPATRRATVFVPYDELDPGCLVGDIHLSGAGFSALWDICEVRGLLPIADLHTHPLKDVRQSAVDRAHPMISRAGHVSLIAPDFLTRLTRRTELGVHVFEGPAGWTSHFRRAAARRVRLV